MVNGTAIPWEVDKDLGTSNKAKLDGLDYSDLMYTFL